MPPPRTVTAKELIAATRRLTRLERKRSGLRKTWARLNDAIRAQRREIHALTADHDAAPAIDEPMPLDLAPSPIVDD